MNYFVLCYFLFYKIFVVCFRLRHITIYTLLISFDCIDLMVDFACVYTA